MASHCVFGGGGSKVDMPNLALLLIGHIYLSAMCLGVT